MSINSEKLTIHLRGILYNDLVSRVKKKNEFIEKIQEVFQNTFMEKYFGNDEEIKFFKEHSSLLNTTYVTLTPDIFDIEITEERHKNIDFRISITLPVISDNQPGRGNNIDEVRKIIKDFLKDSKIFSVLKRMYQKHMEVEIANETSCDKYFDGSYRWRSYVNFCEDCTTTLQLKHKYPEVYQVYLDMKSGPNSKEVAIDNLRRKLGFI